MNRTNIQSMVRIFIHFVWECKCSNIVTVSLINLLVGRTKIILFYDWAVDTSGYRPKRDMAAQLAV